MDSQSNDKKLNSPSETKRTIIKSATAIACVAALCFSANSAVGKYSDTISKIAEKGTTSTAVSASDGESYADDSYYDAATDTSDDLSYDSTDTEVSPLVEDTADASVSASIDSKASSDSSSAPTSNDPTKYSVAQIVNYYNSSLKKTYALPKLTIEKTEDIKIVIDDVTPGGQLVTNLGNKIVNKYATATTYKESFTNGKSNSGGDDAQEFSMHANLDPSGAKFASVKKVDNGYEINITVKAEQATLQKRPGYNSQCSNPLDLGSIDLFGLEVTQADFSYPGTTLKAVVDSQGRVTSAVCYMPMNGTGAGKLGLSGSATVHGSMTKSAKFSF